LCITLKGFLSHSRKPFGDCSERQFDEATSKIAIQGARYPENLQKMVGR
jgi:hypothetical protein